MDAHDYEMIRKLLDDYLQMYASRDDRLTSYFSEDFSGFTGGGDFLVKDREEWVAITRQDFAQVKEPIRLELKDVAIQSLADSVAVATSFFTINLPIKDHILSRETARLVLIFHKEAAGWKISHSSISIPYYLVREGEVYPLKELMDRNQTLEKLIDERTTQLSEANCRLLQTNEALAKEIAEHKQAEIALREREAHYRLLTENSTDVVWRLNNEYRFTYISPADERLRGYRADEVIGHHVFELFDEEGIATLKKQAQLRLAAEQLGVKTGTVTFEAQHRCKDGSWLWAEINSTPERDADGAVTGYHGMTREITERKLHEKERLKMEKLESLGALAGGIAHDFNNILSGIMGNVSFAQMLLDPAHRSYALLNQAEKASERAAELARQLLTFARGGEPVKRVISVQECVNETVTLVLRGSNIKGVVDFPDLLHTIEADAGQINQVIHNIVINASEAMPDGGAILVTAQNETLPDENALFLPGGTYVKLSFSDQGCGIPDEDLKRVFDPYFTTKGAGKGLGLASAHSIVRRHGGSINARSAVGSGTTITLRLPSTGEVSQKPETSRVCHKQKVAEYSGGSILVMDDEEMIRDMTTEMLVYLGFTATTCKNGTEAIALYKAAMDSGMPYAAVIMDLTIPGGMGGKEAAQQIHAIDENACLVVSSGYSNDPIMSDFAAYGFADAIAKPYKMASFGQMLNSVLAAG